MESHDVRPVASGFSRSARGFPASPTPWHESGLRPFSQLDETPPHGQTCSRPFGVWHFLSVVGWLERRCRDDEAEKRGDSQPPTRQASGSLACVGHRINHVSLGMRTYWLLMLDFFIFKKEIVSFFKELLSRINWLIQTMHGVITIPYLSESI